MPGGKLVVPPNRDPPRGLVAALTVAPLLVRDYYATSRPNDNPALRDQNHMAQHGLVNWSCHTSLGRAHEGDKETVDTAYGLYRPAANQPGYRFFGVAYGRYSSTVRVTVRILRIKVNLIGGSNGTGLHLLAELFVAVSVHAN